MKLPKYNLSYNTRDLIHSLAKSICERKDYKFVCSFSVYCCLTNLVVSFACVGYGGETCREEEG